MKKSIIKIIVYILIINILILILSETYKIEASNSYYQYVKSGIEQFPASYRDKLYTLAKKYPNWNFQAYYTGIPWSELIQKERDETIYRNRINAGLSDEWKHCNFVDDGWACASDDAVKYYLDPRNFLTETQIFQFVETSYNAKIQTLKAIQNSVKGTFLDNKITCKDLNNNIVTISYAEIIMEAAKRTNISAFYIKSKIVQEVGTTGSNSVSGTYPGYEGYYNFFNYGAYDEGDDIANGLTFAKKKGWDSQYKAIVGGAELIGKYYINQGQNTSYFNKWDVVGTKILKEGESQTVQEKDLFWHQYMTNIQDPYSQAFSNRKLYENSLQNEITFIIPVYDNMPKEPTGKPTSTYKGNINTELIDIENIISSNVDDYIGGSIYIAEWVGDECRIPKGTPNMTLKSTDGTFSKKMYVSYIESIKYYFDVNIKGLDMTKEYYIEVQLTGDKNISPEENKTQIVRLPNKILKDNFKGRTIKTSNNKISFINIKYIGTINTELIDLKLIQNSKGENYISGQVYIAEWVNGECRTPSTKPQIKLKSKDGRFETIVYINYEGGIKYYFDKNIEGINTDITQDYILEVYLTNENNIASQESKTQNIRVPNRIIGKNGKISIEAKDNSIKITDNNIYIGKINTELHEMNIIQNAKGENYISGFIYIAEWVNGECRTPATKPQITLKSKSGKIQKNVYVNYEEGIKYYFDRNIENIDINEEYYLEVKLTNEKNLATDLEKTQKAKITLQGQIGICTNGNIVKVENNYIKII